MSSLVVHDGEDLQDPGHVGNSEESDEGDLVGLYQEEADGEGERAEAGGDEAADPQAGDEAGEAVTLHHVNISQDLPCHGIRQSQRCQEAITASLPVVVRGASSR